jgi:hypothetical protein
LCTMWPHTECLVRHTHIQFCKMCTCAHARTCTTWPRMACLVRCMHMQSVSQAQAFAHAHAYHVASYGISVRRMRLHTLARTLAHMHTYTPKIQSRLAQIQPPANTPNAQTMSPIEWKIGWPSFIGIVLCFLYLRCTHATRTSAEFFLLESELDAALLPLACHAMPSKMNVCVRCLYILRHAVWRVHDAASSFSSMQHVLVVLLQSCPAPQCMCE